MTKLTTSILTLNGASDSKYSFDIYSTDTDFKESWGGVYAFTNRYKNADDINHTVIYIGKTVKFNQRLDGHEKWDEIKKAGGNCLCILKIDKESEMLKIEEDLIKGQKPKLNVVHNAD